MPNRRGVSDANTRSKSDAIRPALAVPLLRRLASPLAPPFRGGLHVQHVILHLGTVLQQGSLGRQQDGFGDDSLSFVSVGVVRPDDHRFLWFCGRIFGRELPFTEGPGLIHARSCTPGPPNPVRALAEACMYSLVFLSSFLVGRPVRGSVR